MRRTIAAALLASVLAMPVFAKEHGATLEERFEAPPQEAKPRLRWWWPGGDVTVEQIEREIALMDAAGFGGAEIQALLPNGIPPSSPETQTRINDYAEPRFFELVRAAGLAADARGMDLDYTFGSAWPSGGGFAIPPEKALIELTMAFTPVKGGTQGPIKVAMPDRTPRLGALGSLDARTRDPAVADWKSRFDGRAQIVSVLAVRGTPPRFATDERTSPLAVPIKLSAWKDVAQPGSLDPLSAVDLTDRLADDGSLDWTAPEGDWLVFVFRKYASNMGVLGAAGKGPQLVLDHFDRTAFAAHAARVGDPLGTDPPGIRSTFVDSLELMQDLPWSEDFLARFRALRGYDLRPYLPFLVQPGWMSAWAEHYSPPYFNAQTGDLAARVREDYRQTVSDLIFDEFLEPWAEWNKAHGLASKFQAHGGAFDQIRAYGLADIPETEDLVEGGDLLFMRLARSAANLYGRPVVSAEALVWKDRPFDVTPHEMRKRLDLLFAGGVNGVNLHGMPYGYAQENWPGWHAFGPTPVNLGFSTMLTQSNPIWPAVGELAGYAARTQALLQSGESVVPVALFYGEIGYYVGIENAGDHARPLENGLLASGRDFDRINPHALGLARVDKRRLISAGGHSYDALVIPPVDAINAELAERIARFARAGLPVIFVDKAPGRSTGLYAAAARDKRVKAAIEDALSKGAVIVPSSALADALAARRVRANLVSAAGGEDLAFVQRRAGDRLITFLYNRSGADHQFDVILPANRAVTQWNAMNGEITPVAVRLTAGSAAVMVSIPAGQGTLLVSDNRVPTTSIAAVAPTRSIPVGTEGWHLRVEGYSLREPFAADLGRVALGDWRADARLARFAGAGRYGATFDLSPADLGSGTRFALSLGSVHDMAQVSVNGIAFDPVVSAPWRLDITSAVRPGANTIAIEVRNVPQNAMISARGGYQKLAPVPAGLIGPVQIYTYEGTP